MPPLGPQPPVHAPHAERGQGDGQGAAVLVHARVVGAQLHHAQIGQHLQGDGQGRALVLQHAAVGGQLTVRPGLSAGRSPAPGVRRGQVRVEQGVHPHRATHGVEGGRHPVQVLGLQHGRERRVPDGQHVVGSPRREHVEPVSRLRAASSPADQARAGRVEHQHAGGDRDPPGRVELGGNQLQVRSGRHGVAAAQPPGLGQRPARPDPPGHIPGSPQQRGDPGRRGQLLAGRQAHRGKPGRTAGIRPTLRVPVCVPARTRRGPRRRTPS